jgi:colanic acid/amylovoran biosynthesis protein
MRATEAKPAHRSATNTSTDSFSYRVVERSMYASRFLAHEREARKATRPMALNRSPLRFPVNTGTHTSDPQKICIFGAAPGTGNLGVTAMGLSALAGLTKRLPRAQVTMFDDERGVREATAHVGDRSIAYALCGAVPTRRLHNPDSLWRIRMAGRFGLPGGPAVSVLRHADAVLDVSGGDSFTDLYGPKRFRSVTLEKIIALEQARRLILLPQTIGPFKDPKRRAIAQEILRGAAMVWARDEESYAFIRELLDGDYDPERHRCGVDLAFMLEASSPRTEPPGPVADWLHEDFSAPVFGMNVSGVLFNDVEMARRRFGLKADYRRAVIEIVRGVLNDDREARVVLASHVFTTPGHFEHDPDAAQAVRSAMGSDRNRVALVGAGYDPGEMKGFIGRTDFFCATRMHAGIAALSSGTPTSAIAYSRKTRGVFGTCGQAEQVADPRSSETADVVDHILDCWRRRAEIGMSLAESLPAVFEQAEAQMDIIASACVGQRATEPEMRKAA